MNTQTPLLVPDLPIRQPSMVPPWETPLKSARRISIDIETNDPALRTDGPGARRGYGHICGIAFAVDSEMVMSYYYPLNHAMHKPSVDPAAVLNWLEGMLKNPGYLRQWVGANLAYDFDWIEHQLGVSPTCEIHDVCIAGALIDEERPDGYSLEALARGYGLGGKAEESLAEVAHAWGMDPKKDIWRLPPEYVANYARIDAELALQVADRQLKEIDELGLKTVWELEKKVWHVLHAMRIRGVRLDVDALEPLRDKLDADFAEAMSCLSNRWGSMNINAPESIAKVADRHGLHYPRTATGQPSFRKEWLAGNQHEMFVLIHRARTLQKMVRDFVEDYDRRRVGDRLYPSWVQIASDTEDGARTGTRSGRLASRKPNLQQVPGRSSYGAMVRALFLPEDGEQWLKADYQQQEPRLLGHYALAMDLPKAWEFAEMIQGGDCYDPVAKRAQVSRAEAKTLLLGTIYGMGLAKCAGQLGVDPEDAAEIRDAIHRAVPFLAKISQAATDRVHKVGFVRTLSGRRRRFNEWEPTTKPGQPIRGKAEAEAAYGPRIRRAYAYKALNAVIQGSAADMTKMAMVELHARGIVPLIQVHDELGVSIQQESGAKGVVDVMSHVIQSEIEFPVDWSMGKHWAK